MRTTRLLALAALFAVTCAGPELALAGPTVTITPIVDAGAAAAADQVDAAPAPALDGITTSPGSAASAPAAPHDNIKIDSPSSVIDAAKAAKAHGGYFAAGMVLLFVLASFAMRMSGHVGWLAEDRHLVIITSLVGISGAFADHYLGSADWQTVLAAVATGVAKFLIPLHPNVAAGTADPKLGTTVTKAT